MSKLSRAEATKVELLYNLAETIISHWNNTSLDERLLRLEEEYSDRGKNHMGYYYEY